MNRLCLARTALPLLTVLVGGASAAPPGNFSAGPHPFPGSPGAYAPGQFSYPAPGTYGSTNFQPFWSPSAPSYTVPEPPPEWPAVATAKVTVRLPADAKLWVDGQPTKQTGPVREFVTPPVLRAGVPYRYTFRAEWAQDGRPVALNRTATVYATGSTDVDFTKP